jgi:hypothetical protein
MGTIKNYYLYESPEILSALGAQNILTGLVPESQRIVPMVSADLTDEQCKTLIPSGNYCYGKTHKCPFWDVIEEFPHQDNGYCHYLKSGDWQGEGIGLLWDQCKECGVNEYRSDYDE